MLSILGIVVLIICVLILIFFHEFVAIFVNFAILPFVWVFYRDQQLQELLFKRCWRIANIIVTSLVFILLIVLAIVLTSELLKYVLG